MSKIGFTATDVEEGDNVGNLLVNVGCMSIVFHLHNVQGYFDQSVEVKLKQIIL